MLVRFDPFGDVDRYFDELWSRAGAVARRIPMDVVRRDGEVELRFDLPGVDAGSIDVTVERNVLTVRAERPAPADGDEMLTSERVWGAYVRRLQLADTLDTGRLQASYHDGVLTVRAPVADTAKARRIEVAAGPLEVTAGSGDADAKAA